MANSKISALTNYTTPDGVNDVIPIVDNANGQTKKITRNNYLGITGNPVGHTDTQTLSNKTLGNTNTISLKGTLFTLQDDSDTSKQARFVMSGITTATTRSYTLPNATGTLVDLNTSQTLTNKTLTSPSITGGTYANGAITVDSIAGFSSATVVSVANLSISNGVLNSNNSVKASNIQTGAVTTDKISNPYKFRVRRVAAFTPGSSGAFVLIPFDTKDYDTSSNVDVVTNKGRFTAPISGFYQINGYYLTGGASGAFAIMALFKNGTQLQIGTQLPGAGATSPSYSDVVQATAGDYFELFIFNSTAVAATVTANNQPYFSGYLVSNT